MRFAGSHSSLGSSFFRALQLRCRSAGDHEGTQLLLRMLQLDPRNRITLQEALTHPFFLDLDTTDICQPNLR